MAETVWYNPANPRQQYRTIIPDDPNVPSGWLDSQGRDGAIPEAHQVYQAGVNNQGAGGPSVSNGDPDEITATGGRWPNGILNGYTGGAAVAPKKWP